ncbi:MAG TPA: tetratricopeptide repeat protein [Bacteroidia bacterium]|jgi:tetratricopeptide (TPR) repeat protein
MRLVKRKISGTILLLFLWTLSFANKADQSIVFDSANAAYATGRYDTAIKLYESILEKNVESSELYYNLGNAYYKTNEIGLAILNYERAKKLNPSDEDLITNLKLANQRTEDKIEAAPELFITEWKNGIVNLLNETGWSVLCILLLCFSLILMITYIAAGNKKIKKTGFFGGLVFLLITVIIFFIAQHKYELTKYSADAIILSSSVTATGSPSEKGTKLFILHEGTKVTILQEETEWAEIRIANGNVGWIRSNSLKKI